METNGKVLFEEPRQTIYFHFKKFDQEYMGVLEQMAVDKDSWTVIVDGVELKICTSLKRAKAWVKNYVQSFQDDIDDIE